MSRETLFNESSMVKQLTLKLDGQEIPQDDIQSCEVKYDMFSSCIIAVFIIKDTYNLKSSNTVKFNGDTKIEFSATDYQRNMWRNTFRVQTTSIETAARSTYIKLTCFDEASYLLYNYTKAGSSKQSATQEIRAKLAETKVQASLDNNHKTVKTSSSDFDGQAWTIPGSLDYYSFFTEQLKKEFSYIYQTHYEFRIGKIEPNSLRMMDHEYTTDATYNQHMFKIHQHSIKDPDKISIPKLSVIRYVGKEKKVDKVTVDNVMTSIILNGNADAFKNVQSTDGDIMLATTDPLPCQLYDLFESMLKVNQLAIWIVGDFKYNDIGQRVKVKIGADTVFNKNHIQGNQTASGVYVCTSLTDYFTGGKFVQKAVLSRFDNPKVV